MYNKHNKVYGGKYSFCQHVQVAIEWLAVCLSAHSLIIQNTYTYSISSCYNYVKKGKCMHTSGMPDGIKLN